MLNRFPLWKNLTVLIVVLLGALYALPNIYGEDPAVQISGTKGALVDTQTLAKVNKVLTENKVDLKSISLKDGTVLARFNSVDEQLIAKDLIEKQLSDGFSVALNLASSIPNWLTSIGGNSMKLGLDLRGGVRFLMDVDMKTALQKQNEQLQDGIKLILRNERIRYSSVKSAPNYSTAATFRSAEDLAKAKKIISKRYPNLVINENNLTINLAQSEQAIEDSKTNAVEQNLSILRKRVTDLGVAEPVIQRQGASRIVIELPGVQDTARAKEILGTTATLEFRIVNQSISHVNIDRGFVPADTEIQKDKSGHPVALYKRVILGGEHIINAQSSSDENGRPQVNIELDSEGGSIMSEETKVAIGKPMATLFTEYKDSGKKDSDGKSILVKHEEVINVANIQSRLGSSFRITGIDSPAQAQNLASLLRAGALITPIQIVEERTIGPSLGAKNIEQGIEAGAWGLFLVIVFMLFYYRKFGLFADIALVMNLVILIGVMSLIPGATLTLPGIAGIILSVGMSVDANVLIFERIKEELRAGKSVQHAIDSGYNGAFTSIIDSNVTTIITAIILYAVGTGPVKGFAITLTLGVLISMFTAITGTRAIVNLLYGGKKVKKLSI